MVPRPSNSLTVAGLAAALVIAVMAGFYATGARKTVTGFFRIGDALPLSPYLSPTQTTVFRNEPGYDGQFFLTIALDPLLSNPCSLAALDNPRWRYRRILFPAAGWLLGCGQRATIPWTLVLLNAASIVGLVAVVAAFFAQHGRLPLLALWTLGFVGVWVSAFFSTADLLTTLLVTGSIVAHLQHRPRASLVCLAFACLGRETSLLLVPAFCLTGFRSRSWRGLVAPLLAVLPSAGWYTYVLSKLPSGGSSNGMFEGLALPMVGLGHAIASIYRALLSPRGAFEAVTLASLLLAAWIVLQPRAHDDEPPALIRLSGLAFVALLAVAGPSSLEYFVGSQRIFLPLFVLALLGFAWTRRRPAIVWIVLASQAFCSVAFVASRLLSGR